MSTNRGNNKACATFSMQKAARGISDIQTENHNNLKLLKATQNSLRWVHGRLYRYCKSYNSSVGELISIFCLSTVVN